MVMWLLAVVASAAQVLLKVDTENLVVGQSGHAQLLVVSDATGRATLRLDRVPLIESNPGLSVGFEGQGSNFRVVNGRMTQILSFTYRLTALQEGSWDVGPVQVTMAGGRRLTADAVTVVVRSREEVEQREAVVVTSHFDVERAWEGQVVLYEFQLRARNAEARVEWIFPEFEGLRTPQEGQAEGRTYVIDDPEGSIAVSEGALPLIATGTGTRSYDPAIANVQTPIGSGRQSLLFRRVRTDPWAGEPTDLTVVPLPPPPPGFTGLVGDFEVQSRVDRATAAVGESIGWTIRIAGDGALEGYALPAYEPPAAAVYDTDTDVGARIDGGRYRAVATFQRALVPTAPGRWTPPPQTLVTFSPSRGEYVTHRLELPVITVTPGREGAGEVTSFAPEAGPDLPGSGVDMAARPIIGSGRALAWRLGGWLPAALVLTGLPGVLLWLSELIVAGRQWWANRHLPVEVEQTAAEVLGALPSDPEGRAAAYETALRIALAERPDDEVLHQLFHDFLRARFGDERISRDLELRIERAVKPPEAP